jgi:hypothetical protein
MKWRKRKMERKTIRQTNLSKACQAIHPITGQHCELPDGHIGKHAHTSLQAIPGLEWFERRFNTSGAAQNVISVRWGED